MNRNTIDYDVGLSFAGEQREYVEQVADELQVRGIRVFYDDYEIAKLWGKDLYTHLDKIYRRDCRYCILFASKEFARKVWTNHERRSAQARALLKNQEYILPARFDDTPIPGLPETIHYIDLHNTSPSDLASLVGEKLRTEVRTEHLPPELDRLYELLGLDDKAEKDDVDKIAYRFFSSLCRMTPEERDVVVWFFREGCPAELPDNLHIYVDLLRRLTGKSETELKCILGGLQSLGYGCSIRESHDDHASLEGTVLGEACLFVLEWNDLSGGERPPLEVAHAMIAIASQYYCEKHGSEYLGSLDFTQLSSAMVAKQSGKS